MKLAKRLGLLEIALPLLLAIVPTAGLADAGDREPAGEGIGEARAYLAEGEFNAALLVLEALRVSQPDRYDVLAELGNTYSAMHMWEPAIEFYREAVKRDPSRPTAWAGLGSALFELHDPAGAHEALVRAVTLDADNVRALGVLGELALQRGDTGEALSRFQRILEISGETFDALTDLAVVHQHREEWAEARRHLLRAVELYPTRARAHYNLALDLARENRFHDAVLRANRALELDPENLETLRFLGILYFENQVCEEAIRYFDRVLRLAPMDQEIRIGLASCLHLNGDTDRAVLELKTLMNHSGEDYDLLLLVSNFRLEQGRVEDALEMAIRAAALDPDRPDAHYLLGLAYRRLGLEEEALEEFRVLDQIRERERRGQESAAGPDESDAKSEEEVEPKSPRP